MSTPSSLKDKVLRSSSWALTGTVFGQVIRLASNLIMTRLLFPDDFGLMAIVQMLLVGLVMLSDVGTSQSLVYSDRGEEDSFRNTAWTLQVVRGFVTWGIALVCSALLWLLASWGTFPAQSTYADPRLPLIVAVFSFQLVLQGFGSTRLMLSQRRLQLKEITLVKLYGQIAGVVVMVAWGYLNHSIWALVGGGLASMLVQTVLSHTYMPGAPDRFEWNRDAIDELWGFGRWVVVSSAIGFIGSSGDRLLLGGLVDSRQLGLYAIAFLLLTPIQTVMAMVNGNIIFPALSSVRRETPERLGQVYGKFQRLSDLALAGSAGAIAAGADQIIALFYDARYQGAAPMLQILSISLVGARFLTLEQAYVAIGDSKLTTVANGLRLVALVIGVPLGHHLGGMNGAVLAISLVPFAAWPQSLRFRIQHGYPTWAADLWLIPAGAAGWGAGWLFSVGMQAWRAH